jgi:hypothetical protein
MLRRIAALLVAMTAAVGSGQPAWAGNPPMSAWRSLWTTTCATGAITSAVPNGTSVHIEGWIQPCGPAPDAEWALTRFAPKDAYAHLERYTAAPGQWSKDVAVAGLLESGFFAVCLMNSPSERLACVEVDRTQDGQSVTVLPMPVTDPRLTSVTLHVFDGPTPTPTCATCI